MRRNHALKAEHSGDYKRKPKQSSLAPQGLIRYALSAFYQEAILNDIAQEVLKYTKGMIWSTVEFHSDAADAVHSKLERDFKIVPNHTNTYVRSRIEIDTPYNWKKVWFKKPTDVVVYYNGLTFIIVTSYDRDQIKLQFIRKMFDIDKFVATALHEHEHLFDNTQQDRFEVIRVTGDDNNGYGSRYTLDDSNDANEQRNQKIVSSGSTHLQTIDKSNDDGVNYAKDRFLLCNKVDPFDYLYYGEEQMACAERAKIWATRREWYANRHIPWRLGMLFHGVGGTGKSEMAKAIAKSNGIPIYQYYLHTLSDKEFIEEWEDMQTPCIALFEDFDNVFNKREPQKGVKLSFDCVLNQISGVGARDGVLLIITTNRLDHIDEAIGVKSTYGNISTRPGRIDIVSEFGKMKSDQRWKMVQNILSDWPQVHEHLVTIGDNMTPVQFQELCVQKAFELLNED